ncbi:MAG: hypothetical protein A3K76_04855 [Euryarchaeota archaeon RBG_13_57_23]|nr:MAG: hypothetical protein A3K76_04855 [Euryarchaeota archaeon RBG_13_57_23]
MGAVHLGKIHLRWCDNCSVPVLEQEYCSICSGGTGQVKITPPGDARPAFESDLVRMRKLIDNQFGEGTGKLAIPEEVIVLLNKAPDIDRMDEVIIGGVVIGASRFSIATGERFLIRPSGAAAIAPRVSKGWVVIDEVAAEAIRTKSASTLAVGVLDCDPGINVGDEILVLERDRTPVSLGVAKMSSREMMEHKRGTAVKTRWTVEKSVKKVEPRGASWNDVVNANADVISRRVTQAKEFVAKVVRENDLPVAVSYSGGKDSLATLLLVMEAGIKPKLIFVDTGLEFAETRKNVSDTAKRYGLELIVESAGDSFWRNLDHFGPPAKDYRWCCKTCKLGPATQLIAKNFPDGVLSFIGQRAYESQQRAEKGKVWRNPWTPNQLAASPIQKWTALHVWIYLFSKGAAYNPLYERGIERIGCFMCPATDMAELRISRELSDEYARWQKYLDEYASARGKSRPWIEKDLWRWKRLPSSVVDELTPGDREMLNASVPIPDAGPLEFKSTSGYNPCVEGLSMEGIFSRPLPMERVANLLNIIGEVTTSPDGNIAEVKSITVFREGPVMIKARDEQELKRKAARLREVVFRAVDCAACGICVSRCEANALSLDGQVRIDVSKCTHCGACLGACPAIRFKENDLDI